MKKAKEIRETKWSVGSRKMSYQGKQIRNPDGVEGTFGIFAMVIHFLSIWLCFFLFLFFQGYNIKKTCCVGVCVSLIIIHVYIVAWFLNLRKYFSFSQKC